MQLSKWQTLKIYFKHIYRFLKYGWMLNHVNSNKATNIFLKYVNVLFSSCSVSFDIISYLKCSKNRFISHDLQSWANFIQVIWCGIYNRLCIVYRYLSTLINVCKCTTRNNRIYPFIINTFLSVMLSYLYIL
jgi:hypothetical protein